MELERGLWVAVPPSGCHRLRGGLSREMEALYRAEFGSQLRQKGERVNHRDEVLAVFGTDEDSLCEWRVLRYRQLAREIGAEA